MTPINVFLIDDHTVLRHGLRLLLEAQPDMQVIGESDRGRGVAEELSRIEDLDVVVLDVSMPDLSGPQVAAEIRAAVRNVKIVALTRHSEKAYVQQMLQAGAVGYVLKQTASAILIEAIRTVASGGRYVDPAVSAALLEGPRAAATASVALSPREQEIATMVAYGHTNKEISNALGITVKTVETHKSNIIQKLGISSRAELVRFALTQGWLER